MDQEYDVIALGTGFKECILSGLLAVGKKKILQMDRNNYYGGESASLNLEQLYKKFRGEEKVPENMGRTRDYCVDLCPKFLMACGNLVKMLLYTKVTRYLEFKSVAGSYVFQKGKNIQKVPSTPKEALNSNLMGIFQKRRFKNFITWVNNYDEKDSKTHEGIPNLNAVTMNQIYEKFSLDDPIPSFTGHALALELDENYRTRPAGPTIEKIKMYAYSVARYGNSPYIYPIYGLGGLPEGFARLCAVYGGVYMLDKKVDEIVYDSDGHVTGVRSGDETARCKTLIADPSYFLGTDKIRKTGQIARCIAILNHPIPETENADSCQIIVPSDSTGRQSDLYVCCVSYHHKVAAKGKYIAVCCGKVEGKSDGKEDVKVAQRELAPALILLGGAEQSFFWLSDYYEPCNDSKRDGCFISSSFDPTTHFESATNEVMDMYERITGSKLDLTVAPEATEEDAGLGGSGGGQQ